MGRRVWRCMLETASIAMKGLLRATLVRAQKRRAAERASVFLKNSYVVVQVLLEIWTVEVILRGLRWS